MVAVELRSKGRVCVDSLARRQELLDEREQDRDDDSGFDCLACKVRLSLAGHD